MKIVKNSAIIVFLLVCLPVLVWAQNSARSYLEAGWSELVRDNDSKALALFSTAYNISLAQNDTALIAESLLHMGMCTYGTSYTTGLKYATMSLKEYDKLQKSNAAKAAEGRARALQLISTIYSRQGKYKDALALSLQAKRTIAANDTTATLGLIYTSLGGLYDRLAQPDSATYYHHLALEEHLAKNNKVYLPTAYINKGAAVLKNGNSQQALVFFKQAEQIADSTENKQAKVAALLALANWCKEVENSNATATSYLTDARKIADSISDKQFLIRILAAQIDLDVAAKDFQSAYSRQKEINILKENNFNLEKERNTAILETQFQVAEKERALETLRSEQKVTRLTNWLLWGGIVVVLLVCGIVIFILRKINKKDKQLLETQAALKRISEEQQREKERSLQQDIEAKEHQLSALTLQMYQKNEIMQQLQQELEHTNVQNIEVTKIINKGMIQDKEWDNFNAYFESINKNFYAKIKAAFPEVSANDLKICALIKLNLSIKEMAGILNISPDSVKTARYRLRKKLQLVTEENLAEFIKNIGD